MHALEEDWYAERSTHTDTHTDANWSIQHQLPGFRARMDPFTRPDFCAVAMQVHGFSMGDMTVLGKELVPARRPSASRGVLAAALA